MVFGRQAIPNMPVLYPGFKGASLVWLKSRFNFDGIINENQQCMGTAQNAKENLCNWTRVTIHQDFQWVLER